MPYLKRQSATVAADWSVPGAGVEELGDQRQRAAGDGFEPVGVERAPPRFDPFRLS